MGNLLPFVWLAVLVIALVIVVLGIIVGMELNNRMTAQIPNSNPDIKNTTNAIGDAQDKVDILKMIISFFEKLFGFIK